MVLHRSSIFKITELLVSLSDYYCTLASHLLNPVFTTNNSISLVPKLHAKVTIMVEDNTWTIAVGSDSNGLSYKNLIKSDLEADSRVLKVLDLGVLSGEDSTAYPHVAVDVANAVREGKANRGLLICGTGLGVAIAANKVPGIRAVTAHDSYSVERGVLSNDAQILCMGQQVVGDKLARKLAIEWLGYQFDSKSESAKKVEAISKYETRHA